MDKPKNAEIYGWEDFISWAEDNEVSFDHTEDWAPWWRCWKRAYYCGMCDQTASGG